MFSDHLKISKDELAVWQQYCFDLQQLSADSPRLEDVAVKEARIHRLLSIGHYNDFTQYYFSKVTRGTDNAEFHNRIADNILVDDRFRGCLKIARGHAKTSHNGLVNLMRLKALGKVKFVLIVGKSQNDAIRTLGKLQAHLQYNKKYTADFGEQVKDGDWSQGEFTTLDGVKFMAIGRGQSPRGLSSEDSFRPDYILLDDIDDDELCRNPSRVKDLIEWIYDALINAMDMGRGRFVVIGNLISKDSVIAHFSEKASMYQIQVNALDENGVPAWKEKYTKEEVDAWIEFLGYRSAQKELFNNPVTVGKIFKDHHLIYGDIPPLYMLDLVLSYTDPAKANTKTSCNKSTVILGFKGKYKYLIDVFNENCSMVKMIQWQYDRYEEYTTQGIGLEWWIESNFAQYMYIGDYDAEGNIRHYYLPIVGDDRSKPEKLARIEAMQPYFERGEVIINNKLRDNPHWLSAKDHLLAVEKGTRTPLDFPDALEGGIFKGNQSLVFTRFDILLGVRDTPDALY